MSADLQCDPAVLRATAGAVGRILPALRVTGLDPADLAALVGLPGGAALVAEHDRLTAAATAAHRELTEIVAALERLAGSTRAADESAARVMRAVPR